MGYEIYERTGSKLLLGYVGLTQFLPMLAMTLPAGHVADSYERRKIIITTQAMMMLASLGLFFVSRSHASVNWDLSLPHRLRHRADVSLVGSASFLPQLVSREEFPRALTWFTGAFQLSAVSGPVFGGSLYDWTHGAAAVLFRQTPSWR